MSDRETLIADARKMLRELTYVTPARSFKMIDSLAGALAAPVQADEAKLADAIAEELNTDGWIAEEWSNGKLNATARRLVDFAVLPVLRGGGQ